MLHCKIEGTGVGGLQQPQFLCARWALCSIELATRVATRLLLAAPRFAPLALLAPNANRHKAAAAWYASPVSTSSLMLYRYAVMVMAARLSDPCSGQGKRAGAGCSGGCSRILARRRAAS